MAKEKNKISSTENATSNKPNYDVVYYVNHTGYAATSFDRYPEWLNVWISQNYFKVESGRFCLMNKDSNSTAHEFTVGDCVVFFSENNLVLCGAKGIVKLIETYAQVI